MTWIKNILNKFLAWFVSTTIWEMFARHWMAHFTFRVFGYTKFPLEKYFDVLEVVNKNPDAIYAFVTGDPSSLSFIVNNWFTKCNWGHAGIVRKEGDHLYAWHMKGNGLNHWHLLNVMHECDRFALLKLPIEGKNINIANTRLNAIIEDPNVPYNFSFAMPTAIIDWLTKGQPLTTDEDASVFQSLKLYCSEMVFVVGVGLVTNKKFNSNWEYGIQTFEPDDLYNSSVVVYEYRAA